MEWLIADCGLPIELRAIFQVQREVEFLHGKGTRGQWARRADPSRRFRRKASGSSRTMGYSGIPRLLQKLEALPREQECATPRPVPVAEGGGRAAPDAHHAQLRARWRGRAGSGFPSGREFLCDLNFEKPSFEQAT